MIRKEKKANRYGVLLVARAPFTEMLAQFLRKEGIMAKTIPSFHYMAPVNFLTTLIYRLKGYQIVQIHWIYPFPFNWFLKLYVLYAKALGYKIAWALGNIAPHEERSGYKKIIKWLYKASEIRFVYSEESRRRLGKIFGVDTSSVAVLFSPFYHGCYENTISKEKARETLGIPLDKKVLLLFGYIREYKGIDAFIDVFSHLSDEYVGIIAGKPKSKKVMDLINKSRNGKIIVHPHFIPPENVQHFFNACDVVVLPYRQVNLTGSGVISAAFTFRKPVIATWFPGIEKQVGGNGIIVENKENMEEFVAVLVSAIKRIFSMDYIKMGEKAYEYSKAYSFERFARKVIDAYDRYWKE